MSGTLEKRGTKLGMPTWGGFIFGGIFVAMAVFVFLKGPKISVGPGHTPGWVLPVFCGSFAAGGLLVWGQAWRQFAANRSRQEAVRRFPQEPALADYPWHPDGFDVSEWTATVKAFGWAIGMTVFLAMFNWWAFGAHGPWMVKAVVGLFDLIALACWVLAVRQLLRTFKFGHSRVEFATFPYRLRQPVIVRWHPSRGVDRMNKGTFTLRCVEEWTESQGTGKNQSNILVHEEIWSARWLIEQACSLPSRDSVELRYDLPADALPTQLAADRPIFWELEVKLDLPGVNFRDTYLVPVYE